MDVVLAIGGAGGSRITTAVAQVLLSLLDRGMSPEDALLAPRVHHQLYPNKLFLEPHTPVPLMETLKSYGHDVELLPPTSHLAVVSAVVKKGKKIEGVADPRNLDGGCAGWDGK